MADIVAEAAPLLAETPHEGDAAQFREHAGTWSLARRPEEYLSWGTYNIANHLAAIFLSTRITPQRAEVARWRLITRITSRAVVAVNGVTVFDTDKAPLAAVGRGRFEHRFEAVLVDGQNVVTVALFRLGRMAQVGMRLDLDVDVSVEVALSERVEAGTRQAVEETLRGVSLERDLFHHDQAVTVVLASDPPAGTALRARLVKPGVNREQNGPMGPRHVERAASESLKEETAGGCRNARAGGAGDVAGRNVPGGVRGNAGGWAADHERDV